MRGGVHLQASIGVRKKKCLLYVDWVEIVDANGAVRLVGADVCRPIKFLFSCID